MLSFFYYHLWHNYNEYKRTYYVFLNVVKLKIGFIKAIQVTCSSIIAMTECGNRSLCTSPGSLITSEELSSI